jgi:hypothetical protein
MFSGFIGSAQFDIQLVTSVKFNLILSPSFVSVSAVTNRGIVTKTQMHIFVSNSNLHVKMLAKQTAKLEVPRKPENLFINAELLATQ